MMAHGLTITIDEAMDTSNGLEIVLKSLKIRRIEPSGTTPLPFSTIALPMTRQGRECACFDVRA